MRAARTDVVRYQIRRKPRSLDRVSRSIADVALVPRGVWEQGTVRSAGELGGASLWPYIVALTLVLGYEIFQQGGGGFVHWNVCLLGLGFVAVVYNLCATPANLAPFLDRWLVWA